MTISAVARPPEPDRAIDVAADSGEPSSRAPAAAIAVALAVAAGIALRLYTRSPLWLDEALTVNIAELGIGDLRSALERDGAPPLFYALLAIWTDLVGTGDVAVRMLPALFSVLSLWLVYRMGRRRGGELVGVAALVLVATSPFAIRYATEARMYSLVALIVSAGWLAMENAFESRKPRWIAATGLAAGALLLTHYWGFYLVGVTLVGLLYAAWRLPDRRATAGRLAASIVVGSVALFGPWVPTFLYQVRHTGTPWGRPPGPVEAAFTTLVDLGGGPFPEGQAIAAVFAALTAFALLGRAGPGQIVELDLRTRPGVRADLGVAVASVLVGIAAGVVTNSAWASRYTSIAFPLFILVAAFGLRSFGDRRVVAGVLAVTSVLGVIGGVRNVVFERTQASEVARAIAASGERGDVIAYCPDQLGPDVRRLVGDRYEHYTFPDLDDPRFVTWVDYADRMAAADPAVFANEVLERARGKNLFLVWMPGYRSLDKKCQSVNIAFQLARPGGRELVEPDDQYFERHVLWIHPAAGGGR